MQEQSHGGILAAKNLTKDYGDGRNALDNLTMQVRAGEIYVMLGSNGAGKTTTINIFLNLIPPTSGEATICGIATHVDPLKAKSNLAYVSENVMLYGNLTAWQNLEFFARLSGKQPTKEECAATLTRVGLDPKHLHSKVQTFSKGMRQKCGLAIAIMKGVPAILLDEPTSGLDPRSSNEFQQLLHDLRKDGCAILMSSHDIFRSREVADKIGIMSAGKLVVEHDAASLRGMNLEQVYLEVTANGISNDTSQRTGVPV